MNTFKGVGEAEDLPSNSESTLPAPSRKPVAVAVGTKPFGLVLTEQFLFLEVGK